MHFERKVVKFLKALSCKTFWFNRCSVRSFPLLTPWCLAGKYITIISPLVAFFFNWVEHCAMQWIKSYRIRAQRFLGFITGVSKRDNKRFLTFKLKGFPEISLLLYYRYIFFCFTKVHTDVWTPRVWCNVWLHSLHYIIIFWRHWNLCL